MVNCNPLEARKNGTFTFRVTICLKVPDTGRSTDYKLAAADYERVNPEETKTVVEEYPSSFLTPLYFCHKGVALARSRSSDRENVNGSEEPKHKPAACLKCRNEG